MQINIDNILKQQNKTRYWLSQETGITYQNICNLCNNKTSSIRFDMLDRICLALQCDPINFLIPEKK